MQHISSAELPDLTGATAIVETHEHKVAACCGPETPASAPALMLHSKQQLRSPTTCSELCKFIVRRSCFLVRLCLSAMYLQGSDHYHNHKVLHCCSALSLSPQFEGLRPGPLLPVWHSPISVLIQMLPDSF